MGALKDTQDRIAVMQAYVDGERVQCRVRTAGDDSWATSGDGSNAVKWNWERYDYRIEPKPREWWIVPSTGQIFDEQAIAVCGIKVVHVREVLEGDQQ